MIVVAGFGFRGSASAHSLRSALDLASGDRRVNVLATATDKACADCLTLLAAELGLPVRAIDQNAITAARTLTQSPRVRRERATGSLCEAAALAAAGPGARLVSPRHISQDGRATCALAIGDGT